MDRGYARRRVTHGEKLWMEKRYIWRQIKHKRRSYAKRVHTERDYMQSRVTHRKELYKEKLHTDSNNTKQNRNTSRQTLSTCFSHRPLFYIPKLGRGFFTLIFRADCCSSVFSDNWNIETVKSHQQESCNYITSSTFKQCNVYQ